MYIKIQQYKYRVSYIQYLYIYVITKARIKFVYLCIYLLIQKETFHESNAVNWKLISSGTGIWRPYICSEFRCTNNNIDSDNFWEENYCCYLCLLLFHISVVKLGGQRAT